MSEQQKELFVVEGVSAASTIRQAMKKSSQEVMEIGGKIINVMKANRKAVKSDKTCCQIVGRLACGWEDQCVPNSLAFSRIVILTDPDPDGVHARILLVNFFVSYLRPLVEAGLLFVVEPPLYRLTAKVDKRTFYAWSQRQAIDISQAGEICEISHIKGIAQFSLAECVDLLLAPDRQICLTV